MMFRIAALCYLVTLVASGPAILVIRFEDNRETTYCVSYTEDVNLTDSYTDKDFLPLVDLSPDPLCEVPATSSQLSDSILLVPGATNCTVLERAYVAEEVEAAGLIVVLTEDDLHYGNGTSNISVVYMSEVDYDSFVKIQKQLPGEGAEAVLFRPERPLFDPNLFLIWTLAVTVVAIGGYWSGLTSTRNNKEAEQTDAEDEDDNDEDSLTISIKLIVVWVVMLVTFLLLLYFFYNIMVYVVIFMFCLGSWSSLYVCLHPFVRRVFRSKASTPVIPILKEKYTYVSIALSAVCLIPVVCWFVYRKEDCAWILQDILGAAFCISMLKIIHMPNFMMCVLLLGLLFFYDLFFVFITPLISKDGESVMLKVATGGDGATEKLPILFMFPTLSSSAYSVCKGFSLLGFGDVLIPGLLVGFCHSFDMKIQSMKIYYIASTAAYGLGILLTFVALIIMESGQPALVYIVPCTLLTVTLIGCCRRELKALWTGEPIKSYVTLTGEVNDGINHDQS